MKKLTSLLCCIALVLSMLAACGAPAAPAATEAPTEAATETTASATEAPTEAAEEAAAVRLGALTGPTAIGMVKLWQDADAGQTAYTHTLAGSADELTPLLLQGELDIVSIPANLASVLYNKTEGGVQVLGVNVLGVLYICEFGGEEIQSAADLKGKTVYATGKGSTPEYFLRYILTRNGLDPDTDVTLEWKSEPAEVIAQLNADGSGVAMMPQPQVTAAAAKLGEGFRVALSVTDEWDSQDTGSMCTTAVLAVRTAFAQEHPEAVKQFLEDFAASAAWVNGNPGEAAGLCVDYEILSVPAPVLEKAIPKCNIVCITGGEMKSALSGCLEVLHGFNPKAVGGAMPGDDFYYGA